MVCPVNNKFHNSASGCEMYYDEKEKVFWHMYANTQVTLDSDGVPFSKKIYWKNQMELYYFILIK